MRTNRLIALGATLLVVLAACSRVGQHGRPSRRPRRPPERRSAAPPQARRRAPRAKADIRIGSDDFYESKLMAEIYAQVARARRLQGRPATSGSAPARLASRRWSRARSTWSRSTSGSGLGYYDKTLITGDGAKPTPRRSPRSSDQGRWHRGPRHLARPGPQRLVVRKDTADSLKLAKMSDLAAVQDQIKWGLPPDCDTNPICKDALVSYGITYPPEAAPGLAACDAPIAQALQAKAIDLAELCSTQPAIAQFGFVQPRRRQEDPAGREHRPARPRRLPGQGATRPPSRSCSTRLRPR